MYIPLPDPEEQKLVVEKLSEIDAVLSSRQDKYQASQALQKSLINQVF